MKLRGIHIRGKSSLRDISLDFMTEDGEMLPQSILRGNLGTGKTLILQLVAAAWSRSVLSHPNLEMALDADMVRVDFQVGAEIASVHIRNGRIEPSDVLARAADVEVGEGGQRVHHGIVYYSVARGGYVEFTNLERSVPDGIQRCLPVIYDLQMRDIRDSVVLIDDWDMGLDDSARKSFYNHISRHAHNSGNQLILSSAAKAPGFFPSRGIHELEGGLDIISECLKLLAEVGGGT